MTHNLRKFQPMNFKKFTVVFASVGLIFQAAADEFQWRQVTNSVVKFSNANVYNAVANAGSAGGFLCVGTNFLASLAVTNLPLTNPDGGYLFDSSGWTNVTTSAYPGVYLNCVAYGSSMFVAAGKTNATFEYVYGQGWSHPKGANVNSSYDAKGIAYNRSSKTFALVTSSYLAANAADANWASGNSLVWNAANTLNASVVESFRGVTAIGGSNFALSGIFEDIRISTDGGKSWAQNQIINLSTPTNLLAMASDGANTVVAVGEKNALRVSINAGAVGSWANKNLSNAVANSTFYGVTYTGPDDNHFIAVGSGGQVFTCANDPAIITNGANWIPVTITNGLPASLASTLRGVSYAASGPFQGLGMVVGDNGTIFIGGTPPQAPSVQNLTNCALQGQFGSCPNSAFIVSNYNYDSRHPTNSITLDWYDETGTQFLTNTASFVPTDADPGLHYYVAKSRDVRTGLTSSPTTNLFKVNALPLVPTDVVSAINDLTGLYQTNTPLTVSVANSTESIDADSPGATVTADWYKADVNQMSFQDAQASGNAAYGAVTNYNGNSYDWDTGSGVLVATNTTIFHPTNLVCGTVTCYVRARVINPSFTNCICQSTNLTVVTFKLIPPKPISATGATNCAGAECPNPAMSVVLFTNLDNPVGTLTADWYDQDTGGVSLPLGYGTNSYVPTDSVVGDHYYYVETRDRATGFVSSSRTVVTFTVYARPLEPVLLTPNVTNLLTATYQTNAPLTVSVTNSSSITEGIVTADWYTDANGDYMAVGIATDQAYTATNVSGSTWGFVLPATNTLTFIPTNRIAGIYTNWVRARVINTNFTYCICQSTNLTPVTFVIVPPPLSIQLNGTNGVGMIQWFGNLTLQSTTNLAPAVWEDVLTGQLMINTFTWTNHVPPWTNSYYFFRLNTN
jgi:hypothetical protein